MDLDDGDQAEILFLSTPSARRATVHDEVEVGLGVNFYPRPPRGGRPQKAPVWRFVYSISIHALREEGDRYFLNGLLTGWLFLSTPSARRATQWP